MANNEKKKCNVLDGVLTRHSTEDFIEAMQLYRMASSSADILLFDDYYFLLAVLYDLHFNLEMILDDLKSK